MTAPRTTEREQDIEELSQRFARPLGRVRCRRMVLGLIWGFFLGVLPLGKRLFDLLGAGLLLVLTAPLLLLAATLLLPGGAVFVRTPRVGRWGVGFHLLSFRVPTGPQGGLLRALHCTRLPVLLNVLRGDLSLVGPRAAAPGDLSLTEEAARRRLDVRPGLVCPWWLRQRASIDYGREVDVDAEYVQTNTLRGDVALLCRSLPALLFGGAAPAAPAQVRLLGIRLDNLTMDEAVKTIVALAAAEAGAASVCFVNPHCANIACRDRAYREVLGLSGLCLADGIGMKLGGRILGRPLRQNVNGTDLFPLLCAALAGTGRGIFLLGARPGVPEAVAEWIRQRYPDTRVCGVQHGYFAPAELPDVLDRIRASQAAVLLVAFGVPGQEIWIDQHLAETGVRVAMGVGGLFDFYSGRIPRAPIWMREIGLEWVYRFIQEPRRMWKRYLVGNAVFLVRVVGERVGWRRDALPPASQETVR